MMSCFLDILRCILCCEVEERPWRSENLSYYENTRTPNYGSFSRTISPTTDSPSRKQWNIEQTTSTGPKIQHKTYSNSSYTSTGFSRESNEIFSSTRPPEVVKSSNSATLSGFNNKNSTVTSQNFAQKTSTLSSTSEKLGEGTAKGKVCPLTPSPVKAFQHDSTYSKNVLIKGNISDVLKLDSSQRILKKSHESYDQKPDDLLSIASSASLKSSPRITKLGRSSILEKSSNVSQKPKDLPSTMVSNCTFQTKETKAGSNKTIDQKLSQAVSSASSQSSKSFPKLPASSNSLKPSISIFEHISSSPKTDSPSCSSPFPACSSKLTPRSIKPTLSLAPSSPATYGTEASYIWVEKGASPTYVCPEDMKSLIEKDIVPGVLKKRLSMSTYKKFFQALLYAEDIYLEKWEGFEMKDVTLQLHKAAIHMRKDTIPRLDVKKVDKTFVAFEVDKIPEKRPFLLSRDFVTVRPLRNKIKTFEGIIYRVIRSNLVLAEFGEDFHRQHDPSGVYDVTFSFNRVCLKRAHQAILVASDDLLRNFLFPNSVPGNKLHSAEPYDDHRVGKKEACAGRQILTLQGAPPYLVQGPLSTTKLYEINQLSKTGVFIVDRILQICRASSSNRILLCAPTNKTCDVFMRALKKEIPESDMFRANAAFRELDGVPSDILPSCLYEEEKECFSCPSLEELCKFKVILSTFMSSFRLHNVGIVAGHFSHIFLVDASSATEPETLVPLAHLTNERTSVVVTGAPGNRSSWVRSNIARQNGLRISYFGRLCQSRLYENLDPYVITILENSDQNFNHTCGSISFY